jgi:hypothetical protein
MKVVNLSEPDSIFLGVCRGCMPLDQDPQDLRDRTYYLSNGVIRVGGRRVATNAANFQRGDTVGGLAAGAGCSRRGRGGLGPQLLLLVAPHGLFFALAVSEAWAAAPGARCSAKAPSAVPATASSPSSPS